MPRATRFDSPTEMRARRAAFAWLDAQTDNGKAEFTRRELDNFDFDGEPLKLLDRGRGIRNPERFTSTFTIMTSFDSPYADEEIVDGLVKYHYQREDGGDNIKLRIAAETGAPLIYFKGVRAGVYVPIYPVYVVDSPQDRTVLLALGEEMRLFRNLNELSVPQRAYALRVVRQRLHQPQFRANVLYAYADQCAICTLKHIDLLDAAHIRADSSETGVPHVTNGLALCKIHHAAFDRRILGITPNYRVEVSKLVLAEVDGPMLKHGIQAMHGVQLTLPRQSKYHPDRKALEERFEQYLTRTL